MGCGCLDCTDITVPTGNTGATGPQGPAGSNGTNGTNGVALLANQYPNLVTLGTSYESLAVGRTPYVMPANTLSSNGDAIGIHAVFNTNAKSNASAKLVRIYFNNTTQLNLDPVSLGSSISRIEYNARLTRVTNTTAKYELETIRYTYGGTNNDTVYLTSSQTITSLAGLDFTGSSIDIDVQGDSSTIGDIGCLVFEVLKYKI